MRRLSGAAKPGKRRSPTSGSNFDGEIDDAFRVLDAAFESGVDPAYDWLVLDPHLETLRSDPRFEKVLARARADFDDLLSTLDAARSRGEFSPFLEKPLADLLAKLKIKRP